MGLSVTKVGNKGPGKKKYKQPPGTSLYNYFISRSAGFAGQIIDDPGASDSNTIIKLDDSSGLIYNSENTVVVVDYVRMRFASHAWSSGGGTYRQSVDITPTNMSGSNPNLDESIVESPDCANQIVSRLDIGQNIYRSNTLVSFAPRLFFRMARFSPPTIQTTCQSSAVTNIKILVPTSMIVSIPGATAYPSGVLTLVNQT